MRLKWGKWLTTWATFRKRLPSIFATLSSILGALTAADIITLLPRNVGVALTIAGALVAAGSRSVKTGSHGDDYVQQLVPDRRGTGTRTGELPATEPRPLVADHDDGLG